jgi:GT2 family glycosyltransferase
MKDLAIIVPYRDREEHLKQFIPYMKNYLSRKELSFDFYDIEQTQGKMWNKGMVYNAGFLIASKENNYKNYCFHDIDLLPVNVDYSFADVPTHLSSEVEQLGWRYPPIINGFEYPDIFGGIILFTKEDYEKINGFSNEYWGWGGEDDDVLLRIRKRGIKESRRIPGVTRSLKHERNLNQEQYLKNIEILNKSRTGSKKLEEDGLNNLEYSILRDKSNKDYYMFEIKI